MNNINVMLVAMLSVLLIACGGGGSSASKEKIVDNEDDFVVDDSGIPRPKKLGNFASGLPAVIRPNNNDQMQTCKTELPQLSDATVAGRLTFKRPIITVDGELDFNNQVTKPARGIIIEALSADGGLCSENTVQSTIVDGKGDFSFALESGKKYCLRARAQIYREGTDRFWDFSVTNNTSDNIGYYLQDSQPFTAGTVATPKLIDIVANTGWDLASNNYIGPRSAAPLAILDVACEMSDTFINNTNFKGLEPLTFRWSYLNDTESGLVSDGDIGSAFFSMSRYNDSELGLLLVNEIYLLGDKYSDTDEFDYHVIAHELMHYFTFNYSRSESMGGQHGLGNYLDLTVAFDEGMASGMATVALAAVAPMDLVDPKIYRDSLSPITGNGFTFKIDIRDPLDESIGWYSESSVYKTIFNFYEELGVPQVELYDSLIGQRQTNALVSIFSFVNELKSKRQDISADIDLTVGQEAIENIIDDYGSNENLSNNDVRAQAYEAIILPIYHNLQLGAADVRVCSTDAFQAINGLGVYQRFKLELQNNQLVEFTAKLSSGNGKFAKPIISVEDRSTYYELTVGQSLIGNTYKSAIDLQPGVYIVSVAAERNTYFNAFTDKYCYDFSAI